MTRPIPILMYHAVEDCPRPPRYKHFYVTAREFALQMHMLRAARYTPITFSQLADGLNGTHPVPPRPILLTFDDGYANLLTNVHPLMQALGFPYTVFLVAERVGQTNSWVAAEGYDPTPLLGWPEIRRMQKEGGVDFQAHTLTHPHLPDLSTDDLQRELGESKAVLESHLDSPVSTLCYPYGAVDDRVAGIARACGYTQAVTTKTGRVRPGDDPLRLPRLSVMHVPMLSLTYGVGPLNFWWRVLFWQDRRSSSPASSPRQSA